MSSLTSFDTEPTCIASRYIARIYIHKKTRTNPVSSTDTMTTLALKVIVCLGVMLVVVGGGTVKRQVGVKLQEVTTSENCPPGWDPSPCKCSDGPGDKSSVFCDNATNGEEIKAAFAKLDAPHAFANFFMEGSSAEALPGGVFGKGSFIMFFMSHSKLHTLDDNAFQGSEESANHFLLQNNNFENFNFKALEPLKNLQNFELSNGKLGAVPDNAFGEKPLEVVDLNGNEIKSVGKNAFSKLAKLRKIDLSNNKLTELQEDVFNLSSEISPISLLLSHNAISKIDKKAFENVKLRVLEFEDNKLEFLEQEIFEPLVNSLAENHGSLSTLGNPFTCDQATTKWVSDLPVLKRGLIIGYMCRDGRALQQVTYT